MRLRYQSFGNVDSTPGYKRALASILKQATASDTEVTICGLEEALLAGKQYRLFQELDTANLIGHVLEAATGFDALVLGNTMDPGLVALRQALDVPVVGLLEASLGVARFLGRGLWLVCSNEVMIPRVEELVKAYGHDGGVCGVTALTRGRNVPSMAAAFDEADRAMVLREQVEAFVLEAAPDRAEVIVPASGILQVFLHANGMREIGPLPVVNGVAASAMMAELLLRLGRTVGTAVSRRMTYARPESELLDAARRLYSKR